MPHALQRTSSALNDDARAAERARNSAFRLWAWRMLRPGDVSTSPNPLAREPVRPSHPPRDPADDYESHEPASFRREQQPRWSAQNAVVWVVIAFGVGAFFSILPLWAPLLMAAWTAALARPLHERAARRFGGSHRAAGVLTVALVLGGLLPVTLLAVSLTNEAAQLAKQVSASGSGAGALQSIVSGGGAPAKPEPAQAQAKPGEAKPGEAKAGEQAKAPALPSVKDLGSPQVFDFMRQHGASTWRALRQIAGATATALIGLFVFVLGVYTFLVDGKRTYTWLRDRTPIPPRTFDRFAAAFTETGRGLFIGVGLTALLQGVIASIGYFALGLPQAAVLGGLTVLAAFIPSAGAALVWAPVTLALAVTGRPGAAGVMLAIGVVVSVADNLVRPWLSRFGQLRLSMFLLLVAMLGGITIFGAWGLILGPLFVRLVVEGLEILRDERRTKDYSAADVDDVRSTGRAGA